MAVHGMIGASRVRLAAIGGDTMAQWCAALVLSIATWLAFLTTTWELGLVVLVLLAVAVLALRAAMQRLGRRPAIVAVAWRVAVLLIIAPNLFLALAFLPGHEDVELQSGVWWL